MSNRECTSGSSLDTLHVFVFVFSWQGGGLQKWKPLTQSPEPQRYNPSHKSLPSIVFTLIFTDDIAFLKSSQVHSFLSE